MTAAACGKPDVVYEVERRVIERIERPADEPARCALGDEARPAIGCLPRVPISRGSVTAGADTFEFRHRFAVPAAIATRRIAIERIIHRKAPQSPWLRPAALVVPAAGADVELVFSIPVGPAPGPVHVESVARPLPPPVRRTETAPVAVGRGAVLQVAIGIETLGTEPAAGGSVSFSLSAKSGDVETPLWTLTLPTRADTTRRWLDQRIALDAVAGREATLVFASSVTQADADRAVVVPLWAGPEILVPREPSPRDALVLISIDTLRADELGTYGSGRATSPVVDRVADEGVVVERMLAPYPSTTASHMSMLTGVYPATHGMRYPEGRVADAIPLLAELLSARGYTTAAVTDDGMLDAGCGFDRGFTSYHERKPGDVYSAVADVRATVDAALAWLDGHRRERLFLFVHTYQVHSPYTHPPELDLFRAPAGASTFAEARGRYAGAVRYVDGEIGRLLAGVARAHEPGRTIVVVTSDHGEEFGEHGSLGHAHTVYDEVMHVPFVVRAPALLAAGRRVSGLASLVDVTPTVLELLGIPIPPGVEGVSLVGRMRGASTTSEQPIFGEVALGTPQTYVFAVWMGSRKCIVADAGPSQCYDIGSDPGEQRALADEAMIASGRDALRPYRERIGASASVSVSPRPAAIDDEKIERLRALGYLP